MKALVLAASLLATPVAAQPVCGPAEILIATAATQYDERPMASAMYGEGADMVLVLFLVAPDGGFTVMTVSPGGVACIALVGTDFQLLGMMKGDPA